MYKYSVTGPTLYATFQDRAKSWPHETGDLRAPKLPRHTCMRFGKHLKD